MSSTRLILMVLCIFCLNLNAQAPDTAWTKTFGSPGWDLGFSVCQTDDNGYIIAGIINAYQHDIWIIKTDAVGDTMWTKTYGEEGGDAAWSIQKTTDGGFIVAGFKQITNGGANWLLKTDSSGDTLWTCTYDTVNTFLEDEDRHIAGCVQQTFDGGYIITGPSKLDDETGFDFLLIKTDDSGIVEWRKTFGGDSTEISTFVQQTSDLGYILSGYTGESGEDVALLIKTDSNGDLLWSETYTYGTTENPYFDHFDEIKSVKQTSDGGFIFTGTARPDIPDTRRVWLVKLDFNGDTTWTKIYGYGEVTGASDVIEIPSEGYVVAAHLGKESEMHDGWLIRTDMAGDTLWTFLLDSEYRSEFTSVKQTTDDGYIVTGFYQTHQGEDEGDMDLDVLLVKINPDPTGIQTKSPLMPNKFHLSQNYPNPFNPSTSINFNIPKGSQVKLKIFDILGREAATLINKKMPAGKHTIYFNANEYGLASGILFYKLETNSHQEIKKMLLIK